MKSWWIKQLRSTLAAGIFVIPVPLGLYAAGDEGLNAWGFILFLLLSLGIPVHRQVKERLSEDIGHIRAAMGYFLYGWGIVLMAGMGVLDMLTQTAVWQNWALRLGGMFFWMTAVLFFQHAAGAAMIAWFVPKQTSRWRDIINCILIIVPFPCAFLGMFVFPTIPPVDMTNGVLAGFVVFIGFFTFLLYALAMLTFACYFFPWKKQYPKGISRLWGVLRIVATAVLWMGIHSVFFVSHGTIYGTVLFTLFPVFQNNPLVFISPAVFESLAVAVSVYGGTMVYRWTAKLSG